MEQSLRAPRPGDVLIGTVLLITRDSVIIDINYKCEGQVPLAEFLDHEGNPTVKEGDEVDVYFEGTETENGTVILSHAKAEKFKVWRELESAFQNETAGRRRDPWQGQGRPARSISACRRSCPARMSTFVRRATWIATSASADASRC